MHENPEENTQTLFTLLNLISSFTWHSWKSRPQGSHRGNQGCATVHQAGSSDNVKDNRIKECLAKRKESLQQQPAHILDKSNTVKQNKVQK